MNHNNEEARFEGSTLIVGGQEKGETYDARYLISTLLVYVAKSDGRISAPETNRMIDLLSTQLKIPGREALERLTNAVMELADDNDIASRLQGIAKGLSAEQKFEVLWMMMDVMAADDDQERAELDAVTLAGQILGLSLDTIHTQLRSIAGKK
jgi:uncharacterized tellurite resistance protein B-like protein